MAGIVKLLAKNPVVQSNHISKASSNPFAQTSGNPFVTSNTNSFVTYGQNKPVAGGYFAGYYNNQPNIVGRKLFIEV